MIKTLDSSVFGRLHPPFFVVSLMPSTADLPETVCYFVSVTVILETGVFRLNPPPPSLIR